MSKNDNKKKKKTKQLTSAENTKAPMEKSKRLLLIFTSVFLGIVLLFGIVLVTVVTVRNAGAVMSYNGSVIDEGVANYLAASYKYEYIKQLNSNGISASDSERFWSSTDNDTGRTYGELLTESTEEYIKTVLVGSYLFDKNTSMSSEDKETVKRSTQEILDYKANGSKSEFNEMSKPSGFDYSDFEKAMTMLYKYSMAKSVIFGYDGTTLKDDEFSAECNEFLDMYTHVKLLFVRTDYEYEVGDDGKYVIDSETNEYKKIYYDDEKKAEIQAFIDRTDREIYNYENNTDDGVGQMSVERFTDYIRKYDAKNADSGYYFSPTSSYTLQFVTEGYAVLDDGIEIISGKEIVDNAFDMEMGEYRKIRVDIGVCYIYKYECTDGDYADGGMEHFFGDFYSDAADYIFANYISVLSDKVDVKKKFEKIDFLKLPYTNM